MAVVTKGKEATVLPGGAPGLLLAGVFLTSLTVLTLEITLTRLLSVILYYHFVFVVISTALLGLGAGGIFVYSRGPSRAAAVGIRHLAWSAGLLALSVPLSIIAVVKIPYTGNFLIYSLLILVPFFFAGVILTQVFRIFPSQSGRVYGADLLGAAAGSLVAIPLINVLGAVNGGLFVGVVAAVACLLFSVTTVKQRTWLAAANLLVVGALFVSSVARPELTSVTPGQNPDKELSQMLYGQGSVNGRIVESRWSAFGRTDLTAFREQTDAMVMFIDGTAGTYMFKFSGDIKNPAPLIAGMKTDFSGYFPFLFLKDGQKDNALIIGAGGGREVLLALMGGMKQITAVEINPDMVDIMKKYAAYNGGLYTALPNVKVVVAEGRNYLKQQKETYDIIMLSLPVTKTSRSPEGFALSENFIFTKEAIEDYLDHLTDEGQLVLVTHEVGEVMRLLSLSVAALEDRGISSKESMGYIYIIGSHMNPTLVLTKKPITPAESERMYQGLLTSSHDVVTSYLPNITPSSNQTQPRLNEVLVALGSGIITLDDLTRTVAERGSNISVVTDNSPFFYNFELGIPQALSFALWIATGLLLLAIAVPSLYLRRKKLPDKTRKGSGQASTLPVIAFIFLFTMLGVGFMLVEIPLIQRFILFLGKPILSISVLLFSLLFGAGLGSFFSGRVTVPGISQRLGVITLLIALLIPVYVFIIPLLFGGLLALPLPLRILVSAVLLIPLGFLLGFPFPLGIRFLKEMTLESHIPWMWAINATASVAGSVLAVIIAMKLGFTEALLFGAGCYLLASLAFILRKAPGGTET